MKSDGGGGHQHANVKLIRVARWLARQYAGRKPRHARYIRQDGRRLEAGVAQLPAAALARNMAKGRAVPLSVSD
eukprot:1257219-Pyramimonas_sp.AAC.1